MIGRDRSNERLIALFLLGLLLLLPPLLLVFNRPDRALGIPVLYLYVFGAWAGLIGLAALISERIREEAPATSQPGDASQTGERPAEGARRA